MEDEMFGEMIMPVMMMLMMGTVAQTLIPQPKYQCPICGQKFTTYDQLYNHFSTEHPAEPIDIIWE